ncbi:MAG TPA: hypothetical protein VFP34_04775 [Microlunatus sp.]|nr:hypothetical protein [Microlunatus sp.]
MLRTKTRSILVKLGISLGLGLGYLGLIRLYQWDEKSELAPFLTLYALSGVIGGVVCTNAWSWDATRVREALTSGRRLWYVMLSKNLTMFVLVGAVGVLLSGLLAWRAGSYGSSLVKALGQLVTMMLLWLVVGNVLSVVAPLRVEPLGARFKDGTLKPFLLSFRDRAGAAFSSGWSPPRASGRPRAMVSISARNRRVIRAIQTT